VVVVESAFERDAPIRWPSRLGVYAALTLGLLLVFLALYLPWVRWQPPSGAVTTDDLRAISGHVANNITFVYIFAFLVIGTSAFALFSEEKHGVSFVRSPGWQLAGYAVLALAAIPIIANTNLNVSRADVFSKQGAAYE